jgi:hypothetical protein
MPATIGDQFIEVEIADLFAYAAPWQMSYELYNRIGPTGDRRACLITSGVGTLSIRACTRSSAGLSTGVYWGGVYAGPFDTKTIRFESYASGRLVAKLNGTTVIDFTESVTISGGSGQGIFAEWHFGTAGTTTARILTASGGDF